MRRLISILALMILLSASQAAADILIQGSYDGSYQWHIQLIGDGVSSTVIDELRIYYWGIPGPMPFLNGSPSYAGDPTPASWWAILTGDNDPFGMPLYYVGGDNGGRASVLVTWNASLESSYWSFKPASSGDRLNIYPATIETLQPSVPYIDSVFPITVSVDDPGSAYLNLSYFGPFLDELDITFLSQGNVVPVLNAQDLGPLYPDWQWVEGVQGGEIFYYNANPVPLPGAVWLLGSGLGLLAGRRFWPKRCA
jgi:hypothetical protein